MAMSKVEGAQEGLVDRLQDQKQVEPYNKPTELLRMPLQRHRVHGPPEFQEYQIHSPRLAGLLHVCLTTASVKPTQWSRKRTPQQTQRHLNSSPVLFDNSYHHTCFCMTTYFSLYNAPFYQTDCTSSLFWFHSLEIPQNQFQTSTRTTIQICTQPSTLVINHSHLISPTLRF